MSLCMTKSCTETGNKNTMTSWGSLPSDAYCTLLIFSVNYMNCNDLFSQMTTYFVKFQVARNIYVAQIWAVSEQTSNFILKILLTSAGMNAL